LKKRTKKLLLPWTVLFGPSVAHCTVMAAKAARATTPKVPLEHARPTRTAEGNQSFFASFFSKKEVSYLLNLGAA
jgi:hypothetical protein